MGFFDKAQEIYRERNTTYVTLHLRMTFPYGPAFNFLNLAYSIQHSNIRKSVQLVDNSSSPFQMGDSFMFAKGWVVDPFRVLTVK